MNCSFSFLSRNWRSHITPLENESVVEIRPNRYLYIQHLNARSRDEKFENKMNGLNKLKKIPACGPLTAPHPLNKSQGNSTSVTTTLTNFTPRLEKQKNSNEEYDNPVDKKHESNIVGVSQTLMEHPQVFLTSSSSLSFPSFKDTSQVIKSPSNVYLNTVQHPKQLIRSHVKKSENHTSSALKLSHKSSSSNIQVITHPHQSFHSIQKTGNEHISCDEMQSGMGIQTFHSIQKTGNEHIICDEMQSGMGIQTIPVMNITPNIGSNYPKDEVNKSPLEPQHELINKPMHISLNPSVDKDMVIFFIHGVGGSSDVWCAQTKYFLGQGYEIVAPDLIGHGYSCTPRNAEAYHFKEIAADMEEIFLRYCRKRNIVVGHSYGASFATVLARNYPRHVTKLILISGGPPTPLSPQPGVFSIPYCLFTCIRPFLLYSFYKGAFHSKRSPAISKKETFSIPAYVLQHTMNGQDWPDGDELYHRWLTCPSLLIYGAQDQLVSLSEEEDMANVIYSSQLAVIQDAGHMVMLEAPEEVNHLIAEFISQPKTVLS